MYSVAMPISRLCFDSTEMDYDAEYMMVQLLGASGILIGLLFQKYYIRFTRNKSSKQASQIFLTLPAIIIMSISVGIVIFGSMKA